MRNSAIEDCVGLTTEGHERDADATDISALEIPIRRGRYAPLLRAGSRPAGESAGLRDDRGAIIVLSDRLFFALRLDFPGHRILQLVDAFAGDR